MNKLCNNKSDLRQILREQRQRLTTSEAASAAERLAEQCIHHPAFINSKSIAAYLAHQGEIDPLSIMQTAWELGKHIYIPTLHPTKPYHLQFVRWTPNTPLTTNRYGILEPHLPDTQSIISPEELDLVLMPLVAFDNQGNRLGSGGGYYDRTFAFLQKQPRPKKPILMGLAYDFQKVDVLPAESWDIRMDEVLVPV